MRFFRKSKIGSESGFCVSLLDRSIQNLSDHDVSKETKNPATLEVASSVPLKHHDPAERSWTDLFSKETQNPFQDSFGFKNPILDLLKEAYPKFLLTSQKPLS